MTPTENNLTEINLTCNVCRKDFLKLYDSVELFLMAMQGMISNAAEFDEMLTEVKKRQKRCLKDGEI